MSVTLRKCDGKDRYLGSGHSYPPPGWSKLRERREAPVAGKTAALRWAQERERVLLKRESQTGVSDRRKRCRR